MKTTNTRWLALSAVVVAAVTILAWKSAGKEESRNYRYAYENTDSPDTVPARKKYYGKKEFNTGDLDQALRDIDRAMSDLDKNIKIDMKSVNKQVKDALDEVGKIDFDGINNDIRLSLKEVDWEEIGREVKRALKEAEKEIKAINKEAIRTSVDAAKQSIEINGDLIESSVKIGLEAAKIGLRAAKKEIQQLKDFTDELDRDGLINKKGTYQIRIKDNEMYIDGKKQSKEVNEKYSKYFHKGDYTISSNGDKHDHDDDDDDES